MSKRERRREERYKALKARQSLWQEAEDRAREAAARRFEGGRGEIRLSDREMRRLGYRKNWFGKWVQR